MDTAALCELHRDTLQIATEYVAAVSEDDLGRTTPCAEWNLASLLAHMVGQHRGFAAAVRDGDAPKSAYAPEQFTQAGWKESAEDLLLAFARADPNALVLEVELRPTQPLSLATIVSAQLLDTAVHTWDVARSIDREFTPADAITDVVLAVAETIPDGAGRETEGAAFAHAVAGGAGSSWGRALALLGRDPGR